MTSLIDLAERIEAFNAQVRGVVAGDLSAKGTAIAVAKLVASNLDTFEQAAAALRAHAVKGEG